MGRNRSTSEDAGRSRHAAARKKKKVATTASRDTNKAAREPADSSKESGVHSKKRKKGAKEGKKNAKEKKNKKRRKLEQASEDAEKHDEDDEEHVDVVVDEQDGEQELHDDDLPIISGDEEAHDEGDEDAGADEAVEERVRRPSRSQRTSASDRSDGRKGLPRRESQPRNGEMTRSTSPAVSHQLKSTDSTSLRKREGEAVATGEAAPAEGAAAQNDQPAGVEPPAQEERKRRSDGNQAGINCQEEDVCSETVFVLETDLRRAVRGHAGTTSARLEETDAEAAALITQDDVQLFVSGVALQIKSCIQGLGHFVNDDQEFEVLAARTAVSRQSKRGTAPWIAQGSTDMEYRKLMVKGVPRSHLGIALSVLYQYLPSVRHKDGAWLCRDGSVVENLYQEALVFSSTRELVRSSLYAQGRRPSTGARLLSADEVRRGSSGKQANQHEFGNSMSSSSAAPFGGGAGNTVGKTASTDGQRAKPRRYINPALLGGQPPEEKPGGGLVLKSRREVQDELVHQGGALELTPASRSRAEQQQGMLAPGAALNGLPREQGPDGLVSGHGSSASGGLAQTTDRGLPGDGQRGLRSKASGDYEMSAESEESDADSRRHDSRRRGGGGRRPRGGRGGRFDNHRRGGPRRSPRDNSRSRGLPRSGPGSKRRSRSRGRGRGGRRGGRRNRGGGAAPGGDQRTGTNDIPLGKVLRPFATCDDGSRISRNPSRDIDPNASTIDRDGNPLLWRLHLQAENVGTILECHSDKNQYTPQHVHFRILPWHKHALPHTSAEERSLFSLAERHRCFVSVLGGPYESVYGPALARAEFFVDAATPPPSVQVSTSSCRNFDFLNARHRPDRLLVLEAVKEDDVAKAAEEAKKLLEAAAQMHAVQQTAAPRTSPNGSPQTAGGQGLERVAVPKGASPILAGNKENQGGAAGEVFPRPASSPGQPPAAAGGAVSKAGGVAGVPPIAGISTMAQGVPDPRSRFYDPSTARTSKDTGTSSAASPRSAAVPAEGGLPPGSKIQLSPARENNGIMPSGARERAGTGSSTGGGRGGAEVRTKGGESPDMAHTQQSSEVAGSTSSELSKSGAVVVGGPPPPQDASSSTNSNKDGLMLPLQLHLAPHHAQTGPPGGGPASPQSSFGTTPIAIVPAPGHHQGGFSSASNGGSMGLSLGQHGGVTPMSRGHLVQGGPGQPVVAYNPGSSGPGGPMAGHLPGQAAHAIRAPVAPAGLIGPPGGTPRNMLGSIPPAGPFSSGAASAAPAGPFHQSSGTPGGGANVASPLQTHSGRFRPAPTSFGAFSADHNKSTFPFPPSNHSAPPPGNPSVVIVQSAPGSQHAPVTTWMHQQRGNTTPSHLGQHQTIYHHGTPGSHVIVTHGALPPSSQQHGSFASSHPSSMPLHQNPPSYHGGAPAAPGMQRQQGPFDLGAPPEMSPPMTGQPPLTLTGPGSLQGLQGKKQAGTRDHDHRPAKPNSTIVPFEPSPFDKATGSNGKFTSEELREQLDYDDL
ncbi:unnamed protein product [Amoebophrya sp. A25]|nr:unnamed protein product [Amoebophrya sp. A25]|eukprot:GSA25T00012051001.1